MAKLDEIGERMSCDRCGTEFTFDDGYMEFRMEFVYNLFHKRPKPDIPDFCKECSKEVIPIFYQLRDIDELKYCVNKLERAINEKRKQSDQNHRTTA